VREGGSRHISAFCWDLIPYLVAISFYHQGKIPRGGLLVVDVMEGYASNGNFLSQCRGHDFMKSPVAVSLREASWYGDGPSILRVQGCFLDDNILSKCAMYGLTPGTKHPKPMTNKNVLFPDIDHTTPQTPVNSFIFLVQRPRFVFNLTPWLPRANQPASASHKTPP
jgi:hypothetical protein